MSGSTTTVGGEESHRSQGPAGVSYISGALRFFLKAAPLCGLGGKGLGSRAFSSWRNSVPGPSAATTQLTVAAGAAAAERPGSRALPPLLLLASLWVQLGRRGWRARTARTASAFPGFCFLSVLQLTPL